MKLAYGILLAAACIVVIGSFSPALEAGWGGGGCGPSGGGIGGAGGGSSGRSSQATQQRIKVEWKSLRLSAATGEGYAESARPLDDILETAVKSHLGEHKPIVIFISDEEDESTERALEGKIFCNEKIGVAMKRFVCLRGSVQSIPDGRLAEKMARQTPIFYFYDPAGKPVKELKGKRATSTSAFSAVVSKLWDLSYELKLKAYSKQMGQILDEMDKVESAKARLTDQMDRAADKPAKLRQLQQEQDELAKQEQRVQEMEAELLKSCTLKPEFTAAGEESAQR